MHLSSYKTFVLSLLPISLIWRNIWDNTNLSFEFVWDAIVTWNQERYLSFAIYMFWFPTMTLGYFMLTSCWKPLDRILWKLVGPMYAQAAHLSGRKAYFFCWASRIVSSWTYRKAPRGCGTGTACPYHIRKIRRLHGVQSLLVKGEYSSQKALPPSRRSVTSQPSDGRIELKWGLLDYQTRLWLFCSSY